MKFIKKNNHSCLIQNNIKDNLQIKKYENFWNMTENERIAIIFFSSHKYRTVIELSNVHTCNTQKVEPKSMLAFLLLDLVLLANWSMYGDR